jgi:hypothetical protein
MPAIVLFAAGAVTGVVGSFLVRNRRVICKSLELGDKAVEKVTDACRFGRQQVTKLIGEASNEAKDDVGDT